LDITIFKLMEKCRLLFLAYNIGLSAGWYTAAWGVGSILMRLIGANLNI